MNWIMNWERAAILLLALLLASPLIALKFYLESIELRSKLTESRETARELEKSLNESISMVSELKEELSLKESELIKYEKELAELSRKLSKLNSSLSSCLKNLSEERNRTELKLSSETSICRAELSACRSELSLTERASVHLVHWWYDSMGCLQCGTAAVKFHAVLFNAGYETASDVRVVIIIYDKGNAPINTIKIEAGPLPGRAGKVIEQIVAITPSFQRAEVRVES